LTPLIIYFFGAEADRWAELLKKGNQVVKGRLQQRSWRTLEGIHGSKTEIIANQVERCDSYKGKRGVSDVK
jgi:single-stranded DNA-binding protein